MTTEWIEHHGKGYPDLPMDTLVQVRFLDERTDYPITEGSVEYWWANWRHDRESPCGADITHYRVVRS